MGFVNLTMITYDTMFHVCNVVLTVKNYRIIIPSLERKAVLEIHHFPAIR